jgi:anti-sigma regulatory factor (Ser/Thr protein kinase)/CheY-like chemotaxis protein
VALDGLLRRVVAAHSHSARGKGLRLRSVPTRAWVLSDPRLLERLLGNLVSNAVRYTYRGGIVVGVRRAGENLRVEVRDSGIGVAPEHQQLIFQEFFQVANPERDPGKGLGLGLALVERLARRLGHPLYVRSAPGRGSVFGITLPRCEAPAPAADREQAFGGFDARVLVLCARQAAACDSLCRMLGSWGCRVTWAETGTEAALKLAAPPDLILCEDECCGEALPFAKAMTAAGAAPAIIVLGHAPAALPEASLPGGRVKQLVKPVQPAKLRALMHHLLEEAEGTRRQASAPA